MANIIEKFKRGIGRVFGADNRNQISPRAAKDMRELMTMSPHMISARSRGVMYYYIEFAPDADLTRAKTIFANNNIPLEMHTSRLGGTTHQVLRITYQDMSMLDLTAINFLQLTTNGRIEPETFAMMKIRNDIAYPRR